jgi:enoyl-CoA hydratase
MSVVLRERRGRVEVLTLNRPEARNAVNAELSGAMAEALDACEADSAVRAVVLTGAGPVFCAGMDLKAFASGRGAGIVHERGGFGGIASRDFPKPIIAAVQGAALAGGLEIAISCDLVVAADDARFGIPEVTRGLMAAAGGVFRLPRLLPRAIALELAMTGDPIDARRAFELGLVNRVVPADRVVDEAVALAERIGENAPRAVRMSKQMVREGMYLPEDEAWKRSNQLAGEVMSSPDALEGATAFAEKRRPNWQEI